MVTLCYVDFTTVKKKKPTVKNHDTPHRTATIEWRHVPSKHFVKLLLALKMSEGLPAKEADAPGSWKTAEATRDSGAASPTFSWASGLQTLTQ